LTIVVVAYKSADSIANTIDHLETAIQDCDAEILVIDNASHDGTSEVAARHLIHGRVLEQEVNLGYGPGVNEGLRHARGEFALIMNDDILLTADSIRLMIEAARSSDEIGLVGARIVYKDGSPAPTHRRYLPGWKDELARISRLLTRRDQRTVLPDTDVPFEVGLLLAACVLGSTNFLRSIGGFNEQFFFYGEDIDLCKRLEALGRSRMVVPSAVVVHDQDTSPERRYHDREFSTRILTARDCYYRIWLARPSRVLLNIYRGIRPADQPFLAKFHLRKALYDGPNLRELRSPPPLEDRTSPNASD
jgi:GT2 family glycosyltransferase